MSVIIKGMEMPKNCYYDCPFEEQGLCCAVDGIRRVESIDRPDWCPLEELSEPKPCNDCPLEPFAGSTFFGYRLEQLAKFAKLCESLGYTPQDIEDIHYDINRLYVDFLKRVNEEVRVLAQNTVCRPESPYEPVHRNPEDAYREDME